MTPSTRVGLEGARPLGRHPGVDARPPGVLVVDDDAAVRRVLRDGMHSHGFAVWLAAAGVAAVEADRSHSDAIDVVLLEVRMPGPDGPQTLAALKRLNPEIHCYFMCGHTGRYTEKALLDLGARAVVQKPMKLAALAHEFNRTAAHRRAAASQVDGTASDVTARSAGSSG